MSAPKITVRRLRYGPSFTGGDTRAYSGPTWAIYVNGARSEDQAVADGGPGLTVIRRDPTTRRWTMATCWHIGIGPGDLARRYIPRLTP